MVYHTVLWVCENTWKKRTGREGAVAWRVFFIQFALHHNTLPKKSICMWLAFCSFEFFHRLNPLSLMYSGVTCLNQLHLWTMQMNKTKHVLKCDYCTCAHCDDDGRCGERGQRRAIYPVFCLQYSKHLQWIGSQMLREVQEIKRLC